MCPLVTTTFKTRVSSSCAPDSRTVRGAKHHAGCPPRSLASSHATDCELPFFIIDASTVKVPSEPDRELMATQKDIHCQRLPLYLATSILTPGASPPWFCYSEYGVEAPWNTDQSLIAMHLQEESKDFLLPRKESHVSRQRSRGWWPENSSLSFPLWLSHLTTGLWPCLPLKAIT